MTSAPADPRLSQPGTRTSEYPEVSSPPSQGAGGGYMEILLVIAILWLVGNLVYEVTPAVREGYRWARINLQLMRCILVVCGGLIVSAYIWGKAQRHTLCTRLHGGGHPSRRHPVTNGEHGRDLVAPEAARVLSPPSRSTQLQSTQAVCTRPVPEGK